MLAPHLAVRPVHSEATVVYDACCKPGCNKKLLQGCVPHAMSSRRTCCAFGLVTAPHLSWSPNNPWIKTSSCHQPPIQQAITIHT